MKLHLKSFTLSCGILWGIAMAAMTIISGLTNYPFTEGEYTGYGGSFLNMMESVYPGYSISPLGLVIGLAYGFVDGIVCGFIFGWVYNRLVRKLGSVT